ncbi:N-6 DNA methylase [Rhizomicrobium electricum]|uniref:site-specific DNA-methyltransferase (adenine-specific) n=1 Tax=Rhizomicrobium electricum TaxID=480070 RepID=A0ABP3PRV6_9PROT|nr:N-6 DNA methylase [Rhizomicrobium electricum]NIJ49757.1 type I restriction enzyme M protein [Rhizomicrobium electricum]
MLDSETKRRIDTARDILVGKVPDPKSQVEQITIAMIYKFMDDMDAESEEFGGKRKFFSGEYARYGWAKLMRSGLGGHETLNLYAEAIGKMPENPGVPPLFRDIFKNAYLPYRDPETLREFLKIIDEFTYDHSERLGDAFEYLLSVLGSQGDAGQFRTPRHIIDFMVEIVDPKKTETVLDPACGTAGFLISSYKHIFKASMGADGQSTLTPDDKGMLAKNFTGYDISPDMVRLSLVNLYLHGFTDPHIYEYDTLTSQERWNQYADVILANPPFMSPKGGIKPHNRFSVQSKRSEVLFVNYMAEHLTPSGRAGIIVPEGIIFQGQSAYVQLRKMLVEEYLVAVISLPAGVFNPYSGVKTSILIFDKTLAKLADTIAFFRAENDGFSLGAQRRSIEKNDLPQVSGELREYLRRLRARETLDDFHPIAGFVVAKEKVAANGEFNLGGERYREGNNVAAKRWPLVELGKIARLINGRAYKQEELLSEGPTPVLRVGNFFSNRGWYYSDLNLEDEKYCDEGDLLYAWSASFGPRIWQGPRAIYHYHIWKIEVTAAVDKMFLFHLLAADSENIKSEGNGIAMVHATKSGMERRKFPLPPLEVQKEIVAEIEGYQKVIDGARAVLDNYHPCIPVDPEWPQVPIGEICAMGGKITTDVDLSKPYFGADSFEANTGRLLKSESAATQRVNGPVYEFSGKRLLYSKIRPYLNKLTVIEADAYCSSDMYPLAVDENRADLTFIATTLLSDRFQQSIRGFYERASIPKINREQLFGTVIALPPLNIQQAIVAEIKAEQDLVNANRELVTRFEKKIQVTLARVWGDAAPSLDGA